MALILTRSPFHIGRGSYYNASIQVDVKSPEGSFVYETYTLSFRSNYLIDIAPLCESIYKKNSSFIGGYNTYITPFGNAPTFNDTGIITVTLSGEDSSGVAQDDIVTNYTCANGYVYSTEPYNKDFHSVLLSKSYYAGSSDIIYKLDDANLRIPILNPTNDNTADQDVYVNFMKNDKILYTDTITLGGDFVGANNPHSQIARTFDYDSFLNRVNQDDGTIEESKCYTDFFEEYKIDDVDKIHVVYEDNVHIINVKTVEECKYNPYRITFRNRFGVMEDLWFFKKSTVSMSVKGEEFRANQLTSRVNAREIPLLGYQNTPITRSSQEYNKNGVETVTLNSGFVDEALNESFKQLMLSEEVELYDFNNDVRSAVKVKDSELKLKTSTNDKLINYTIEVEMSNSIIDNII